MKVKISSKILSISPHISTQWKNISSLQIENESDLVVTLYDGSHITVPGLDQSAIDAIFEAHSRYTDTQTPLPVKNPLESPYTFSLPFSSEGNVLPAMAHNPEQAHLEPLPAEILQKIAAVTRALGLEEIDQLAKGEPHCNCLYCQVARAMQGETEAKEVEEIVADADLQFRSWDVKQTADKLYAVVNPLDENEQYNVFLGEPLGCTCGNKNCEHIRAVLNT